MKQPIYHALLAGLIWSCGPHSQGTKLSHIDDPSERGASSGKPWHFHTGQGFVEIIEQDGKKVKASCTLGVSRQ